MIAGAEQALAVLVSRLPSNMEVTIIGPDRRIVEWVASHRDGCAVVVSPPLSTVRHLRNFTALRRTVMTLDPTAVHLNKTEVAGLRYVEMLCRSLNCRVVSVVHHVERPVTTTARWLTRRLAGRASAVVAVSEAVVAELGVMLGLATDDITVIPNAVELPPVEHRASSERFTIGVLSRFVPHKCLDHILRAAAKVPDADLLIGGSGPSKDELVRLSHDLGIAERVDFLGWVDPDEVLDRCDIVALASRIEGHPVALLDAQARGIPAVATEVGGVGDIVVDGETGYVVPQGDIEAMATAFTRLVDDPALVSELGAAARRRAEAGYRPSDMARSYLQLYWPCG